MKGIILAGGSGTRLYPLTKAVSKQILSIYDKPMIYYPLSTLMLAGIQEILIISTQRDVPAFQELLGDGSQLGLKLSYAVQDQPNGIAEAFLIGEEFIGGDRVALILGDNIFYARGFSDILRRAMEHREGATIFGYQVNNPEEFGIVEFDKDWRVLSIEEKPKQPKSNYAVPGLYFRPHFLYNQVGGDCQDIQPSARGEKEITAVKTDPPGQLRVELFGRGMAWLDTGTHAGLLEASNFVSIIQRRQGLYVSCIEEIAYRRGYIDKEQLLALAQPMLKTELRPLSAESGRGGLSVKQVLVTAGPGLSAPTLFSICWTGIRMCR